jgi:hypothetical protein
LHLGANKPFIQFVNLSKKPQHLYINLSII